MKIAFGCPCQRTLIDCPLGGECIGGICLGETAYHCTTHSDCGINAYCYQGECIPAPIYKWYQK